MTFQGRIVSQERSGPPALTVRQPWASLIAQGVKHVEVRSWATSYRGEIIIHAGGASMQSAPRAVRALVDASQVPLGALIARVLLYSIVPLAELWPSLTPSERLWCGKFRPGLWAWRLRDPRPISPVVPCSGRQGLWTVPPSLLR